MLLQRHISNREGGSVTDLALSRGFVTQDYRESSKTLSQRQFQRADVDVCTSCDALTNHRGMHPRLRATRSCGRILNDLNFIGLTKAQFFILSG